MISGVSKNFNPVIKFRVLSCYTVYIYSQIQCLKIKLLVIMFIVLLMESVTSVPPVKLKQCILTLQCYINL